MRLGYHTPPIMLATRFRYANSIAITAISDEPCQL